MGRPIIKNFRKGRVSYDGNSMVGGRWWGCDHLAYKTTEPCDFIGFIDDEDRYKEAEKWFEEHGLGTVKVEAYFHVGEDESTGSVSCDLDEWFYPEGFDDKVEECPHLTEDEKVKVMNWMQDFSEDEKHYELYAED